MSVFESILMGIIQGITEFLPVSSSGHLAIVSRLLPSFQVNDMFFDVMLHFGTLVAVLAAFWKQVSAIVVEFFRCIGDIFTGKFSFKNMSPTRCLLVMLIVATLPLLLVLPIKDTVESLSGNLIFVGIALLLTSALLFISDRIVKGDKTEKDISYKNALTVGLFQVCATMPGISRSGATMAAGLFCGFEKDLAISFAFLMSIPAVLGAGLLKGIDVVQDPALITAPLYIYLIGMAVSAVVGYASICLLKWMLKKNKFTVFSVYCAVVGVGAIVLELVK